MSALLLAAAGVSAFTAGAGFVAGRVSTRGDRRAAARALVTVRKAALVDALTGVANRAGLEAELDRRAVGIEQYAVLLVDLDEFKAVNDKHGHAAGDLVLVEVAARLSALVAGAGLVGRLGGDEFVVVASSPVQVISKLLGYEVACTVAAPIDLPGGTPITVRASVGVVQALPGDERQALLRSADIAMYEAKELPSGVCEYDSVLGLADVEDLRPLVRLRDLTATARSLAGVRS